MTNTIIEKATLTNNRLDEKTHQSHWISKEVYFQSFTALNQEEIKLVFQWRNHPDIKKWMFTKTSITIDNHLKFISNLIHQKESYYWLVKDREKELGVVSLAKDKLFGTKWGFYLNPDYFGSGYAVDLIHHALYFFFKKIGLQQLNGFVNCYNVNSILLHHLFGIRHILYTYRRNKNQKECYSLRHITASQWQQQDNDIKEMKQKIIVNKKAIQNYKKVVLTELEYLQENNVSPNNENSMLII
ncbi:MAG: GNAT family N-acetyltransferase [Saprospiraceae bacterium]